MLKFVDNRTQVSAPPSHPSYYNRRIPSQQLMAMVSPFENPKDYKNRETIQEIDDLNSEEVRKKILFYL